MVQRRTIHFSGEVQGVGFRATVCRLATGRPLSGYAKNLPDGRVELVVEGEPADIDALVADLRGHFRLRIEEVASTPGTPTGEFASFGLRY